MIKKFEKYATFQCLRQLYQQYMSGVNNWSQTTFMLVGINTYIYVYI